MPTLKTIRLNLKTLDGVKVKDLFTLSTNQTIDSNIAFERIYAENIDSNLTNGISLSKSAVMIDQDAPVKGDLEIFYPIQVDWLKCFFVRIDAPS